MQSDTRHLTSLAPPALAGCASPVLGGPGWATVAIGLEITPLGPPRSLRVCHWRIFGDDTGGPGNHFSGNVQDRGGARLGACQYPLGDSRFDRPDSGRGRPSPWKKRFHPAQGRGFRGFLARGKTGPKSGIAVEGGNNFPRPVLASVRVGTLGPGQYPGHSTGPFCSQTVLGPFVLGSDVSFPCLYFQRDAFAFPERMLPDGISRSGP